ncbi:MAG: ribosomal RNA small subunit methyltransferase A [Deltaproteobacteria bacterium]|nr:ribosomal RNA small subunit methyltransferase A [Deltaproteobacteria bacterium]
MMSGYQRPKKRLGQHYLTRSDIIHEIVHRSRFGAEDIVLEIGPGKGALTIPLAPKVSHIFAVEKDLHLVAFLNRKISHAGLSNITLIHDDILRFNLAEIMHAHPRRIQVIGNLPYNISSPCLEKLVTHRSAIGRAILMFQREFALRLCASPGEKAYGAMTVLVNYNAKTTHLLQVSRNAFSPRPKVDSIVLEIDFERPYSRRAKRETAFQKVVKGAFSHRRKTLINSLRSFFPSLDQEELHQCLAACKIDPRRRAETLGLDEFLCMADKLPLTNEA